MNRSAEAHIARAKGHLAKGNEYYAKAGEEILAARKEGATWPEIADGMEQSESTVRRVAEFAKTPASGMSPETGVNWQRGSHGTRKEIQAGAKKLLAEAPIEEVREAIAALPRERQREVARAAYDESQKAMRAKIEQARSELEASGAAQDMRDVRDRLQANGAVQEILGGLAQVKLRVRQLAKTVNEHRPLIEDDDVRQAVDEEIEETRTWVEMAFDAIQSGDLDATLAQILSEAAAGEEQR